MAIALGILAVREETLWYHQMQIVLGAGHRDIEQAALLLDLRRGTSAEVRRNAAVHHVETEHRLPFLALSGVDGRKDQIVFVEHGHTGLIAGRVRWIQCEFREKSLARRIARGDLFELAQIRTTDDGVFMDALKGRFVPQAGAPQIPPAPP